MLRPLFAGLGLVGALHACASFAASDDDAAGDGGARSDATGSDDGGSPGTPPDAGVLAVTDYAACPPAPGFDGGIPEAKTFFTPPGREFPFDIVTDSAYVYWLAQPAGEDSTAAYNGHAAATLRRVSKRADRRTSDVLATGLVGARHLALDGADVYVATWSSTPPAAATLVRVPRLCTPPCPDPHVVVPLGNVEPVDLLPSPFERGVLAVLNAEGFLGAIALNGPVPGIQLSPDGVGKPLPAMAVGGMLLGASANAVTIRTFAASGAGKLEARPFATMPDAGGAPAGLSPITSDCTDAFGIRRATPNTLYRIPGDGGVPTKVAPLDTNQITNAFAMRSDARYVYVADGNLGAYALDKATGTATPLTTRNAWGLAVDPDGVYVGDHTTGSGGEILFFPK